MVEKVFHTIEKYSLINRGEKVVVGVSGGPDSVCLLHVLKTISEKMDIKLYAVHINHMLRGAESDLDEEYVRNLCKKLDVSLYAERIDVASVAEDKGLSLEEAGREARYQKFYQVADQVGAEKIAVAHNKNDQAETVLMNFIRGSGLAGLAGMDFKRDKIIRPLLEISRAEIEEYCKKHSLNPRTDSSNLKSIFTRNRIRLELIPAIDRMFGTNITETACRTAAILKDDNEFLESSALKLYRDSARMINEREIRLNLSKIEGCHIALIRRVIRRAIFELKKDLKGIGSVHTDDAARLILEGNTGSEVHLPSCIRVRKSYNQAIVNIGKEENSVSDFMVPISVPGITEVAQLGLKVEAVIEDAKNVEKYENIRYNSLVQFFDYEKLMKGICIRNRRNGDVFKPLKSNGTKKLKEYFIDLKVPRDERDRVPLVAQGKEIVWVTGYKISDKFKVTDNTKRVLKLNLTYERE